jgi:hypothetical protein
VRQIGPPHPSRREFGRLERGRDRETVPGRDRDRCTPRHRDTRIPHYFRERAEADDLRTLLSRVAHGLIESAIRELRRTTQHLARRCAERVDESRDPLARGRRNAAFDATDTSGRHVRGARFDQRARQMAGPAIARVMREVVDGQRMQDEREPVVAFRVNGCPRRLFPRRGHAADP